MVQIELNSKLLTLRMPGWDTLWSCRRKLSVPVEHIVGAKVAATSELLSKSGYMLRFGGTALPGVIIAGQYYGSKKWSFWNVHKANQVVAIDLKHEHFSEIIIEVNDPDKLVKQIQSEIGQKAA